MFVHACMCVEGLKRTSLVFINISSVQVNIHVHACRHLSLCMRRAVKNVLGVDQHPFILPLSNASSTNILINCQQTLSLMIQVHHQTSTFLSSHFTDTWDLVKLTGKLLKWFQLFSCLLHVTWHDSHKLNHIARIAQLYLYHPTNCKRTEFYFP